MSPGNMGASVISGGDAQGLGKPLWFDAMEVRHAFL